MQNPVYQDQQEKSKMEKIQKIRIFQGICLGFLPASFRSKKIHNPPTPSIDLKRKQEEKKPAFWDSFWFLYERLWGHGT